ncbi:hypothetical protein FA15DRAFT_666889 [Coprinopsis marcescibilis]|uniref:Uncharacterized protein n=1 Tax=Coprinopsis marcescibilis TaxID=230819 RepID=A0A5C3L1T8_COPMA|nr:hypothetical protein FA15DRAFT_666889 [Coprinopsis marcescibilis]
MSHEGLPPIPRSRRYEAPDVNRNLYHGNSSHRQHHNQAAVYQRSAGGVVLNVINMPPKPQAHTPPNQASYPPSPYPEVVSTPTASPPQSLSSVVPPISVEDAETPPRATPPPPPQVSSVPLPTRIEDPQPSPNAPQSPASPPPPHYSPSAPPNTRDKYPSPSSRVSRPPLERILPDLMPKDVEEKRRIERELDDALRAAILSFKENGLARLTPERRNKISDTRNTLN